MLGLWIIKGEIVVRELFNRPLNMGDLVLFNSSNGHFKDIRYGLVLGENVIYSNGRYNHRIPTCFKINSPCSEEKVIYDELVNQFQNEVNGNKSGNIKLELGGLYMQSNTRVCYLYLGEVGLYDINNSLLDESKHVFLEISLYFNSNLLSDGNQDLLFDFNRFKEFLNRELGNSIRDKNSNLLGYPHLKFTKRNKKFVNQVGKLNLPVGLIGCGLVKINNSCFMEFKGV